MNLTRTFFPLALALAAAARPAPAQGGAELAQSDSAFERAFADSPVRFLDWSKEVLDAAKAADKPIFLLVGEFTDQLARAMRDETFARPETADTLNTRFIPAIADRSLHPELAAFLETYVHSVKQMQGWPLNVWLTPEGKPFEGASYLPPADEWGKEGFPNVLQRVTAAWEADPGAQRARVEDELAAMLALPKPDSKPVDDASLQTTLSTELAGWIAQLDSEYGGFGEAPKRLQPELLRALLRAAPEGRDAALKTLQAIVASPVRDPLDGGFFRGAHDPAWREPALQKRLIDQARMALALLDANQAAPGHFALAAQRALRFALTLEHPDGGYIGAIDGTADAAIPSYFWTTDEVREALGDDLADRAIRAFGFEADGNLGEDAYLGIDTKGKNLPRSAPLAEDWEALSEAATKLREIRDSRVAPARDSLASAGAHGHLLSALTRAGAELNDADLAAGADRLAAFIAKHFVAADKGALRVAPSRDAAASPRDYALVVDGLLRHADARGDEAERALAYRLLADLRERYGNEDPARVAATSAPFAPGVWARIPVPAPGPDEGFSAETGLLSALDLLDAESAGWVVRLAEGVAGDIANASVPARGDQLLALQARIARAPAAR